MLIRYGSNNLLPFRTQPTTRMHLNSLNNQLLLNLNHLSRGTTATVFLADKERKASSPLRVSIPLRQMVLPTRPNSNNSRYLHNPVRLRQVCRVVRNLLIKLISHISSNSQWE